MRISLAVVLMLALIPGVSRPADAAGDQGPKVYISVDMEGTVGAVTSDQLGPDGFEYARFREFMTREALAAVEAAKSAGAGEILVSDSHGNGQNLLFEKFPPDVRIIRSWPRRLAMMAGIDQSFDAAIFIGYHSSTNNPKGVRAHTFSSARLTSVKLNGTPVTEGAFNAAIAGHFGVPVVMISGDDQMIAEVRSLVGDVEGAAVKKALGFHSAETMTPDAAYTLIGERVGAALARVEEFEPYRLESPIELEVSFKHYRPVEVLGYLRAVERIDSHTIRFQGEDMLEVSDFMNFILNYDSNAQP
jgi:D-amino peptidase